jgi:hypothetical protein
MIQAYESRGATELQPSASVIHAGLDTLLELELYVGRENCASVQAEAEVSKNRGEVVPTLFRAAISDLLQGKPPAPYRAFTPSSEEEHERDIPRSDILLIAFYFRSPMTKFFDPKEIVPEALRTWRSSHILRLELALYEIDVTSLGYTFNPDRSFTMEIAEDGRVLESDQKTLSKPLPIPTTASSTSWYAEERPLLDSLSSVAQEYVSQRRIAGNQAAQVAIPLVISNNPKLSETIANSGKIAASEKTALLSTVVDEAPSHNPMAFRKMYFLNPLSGSVDMRELL